MPLFAKKDQPISSPMAMTRAEESGTSALTKAKKTNGRTRLSRDRREKEIIAAARSVFESRGYEDATIAEIAEAVGVVEGTVLHYFRSKRALMSKVIENFYQEITGAMENGVDAISGAQNKLRYVAHTHMAFLQDNAELCTVILSESRGSQKELLETVHDFNRRYTNVVVNIIREGKANGEIAEHISPILVRNVVFGAIEHYLWDIVAGNKRESNNEIADQLTRLVFNGVIESPDSSKGEINHLILKLNKLMA